MFSPEQFSPSHLFPRRSDALRIPRHSTREAKLKAEAEAKEQGHPGEVSRVTWRDIPQTIHVTGTHAVPFSHSNVGCLGSDGLGAERLWHFGPVLDVFGNGRMSLLLEDTLQKSFDAPCDRRFYAEGNCVRPTGTRIAAEYLHDCWIVG